MNAFEHTTNLKRFACLMEYLNQEGMDTKLIELGKGFVSNLSDDEELSYKEDLENI